MKNHKKTISYSLLVLFVYSAPVMAYFEKAGYDTLKAAEPLIKTGFIQLDKTGGALAAGMKEFGAVAMDKADLIVAKFIAGTTALAAVGTKLAESGVIMTETAVPAFKDLAVALPNAGANFGANFGVGALQQIGNGYTAVTVLAAAHPVVTGIIVGVFVVVIVSYGSYKVYKIYRRVCPDAEKQAKIMLDIAKSQAATAAFKIAEEKSQKETALKASLIQNASSKERTASGLPVACQKAAHDYAIVASQKKVDKIVAAHLKYGPQSHAAMASRA